MQIVTVRERIETRVYEVSFDPQQPPVELLPVVLVPVVVPKPPPPARPAAMDSGGMSNLAMLIITPLWLILFVLIVALAFGR